MSGNNHVYTKVESFKRKISLKDGISISDKSHGNFSTNRVISSRYTWYNFLFKNLFEQFQSIPNIYFFLIGLLQMIKTISVTQGIPNTWPVLAFVMTVSGVRAAYEDYQKHKVDNKRNSKKYHILNGQGTWENRKSGDIKVGDIIQVLRDEMIPADILLIGSSKKNHQCFIDYANLNGETRLEVMDAIPSLTDSCKGVTRNSGGGLHKLSANLRYEEPSKKFDQFNGDLEIMGKQERIPIGENFLMLREANLRNCEYAIGLVVYTGYDSKIEMSHKDAEKPKLKMSHIFKLINKYQIYLIQMQVTYCIILAAGQGLNIGYINNLWYINSVKTKHVSVYRTIVYGFFGWFQVLSQTVPISLIVTSEMVKVIMTKFIQWDEKLYSLTLRKGTKVNNSTIHEDTGLVDIIFSDKTGTLTQNKMAFRYLRIPGHSFGSKDTSIYRAMNKKKEDGNISNESTNKKPFSELEKLLEKGGDEGFSVEDLDGVRRRVFRKLNEHESEINIEETEKLRRFMKHMALSNTVKPYLNSEGQLDFQADSAEESAMVRFAQKIGFTKLKQNPTILRISEKNKEDREEEYMQLAILGFTSKRARVTVIYQHKQNGKIHVMTKGQDTVIIPIINLDEDQMLNLERELSGLSIRGMRTLVCAYAELNENWWKNFEDQYHEAIRSNNSNKQHEIFGEIERAAELQYLGIMGLEDQLQSLAPEVINDFFNAGIKVWMLTGDKLQAAHSIGIACNLITPVRIKEGCKGPIKNKFLIKIIAHWYLWIHDDTELEHFYGLFEENKKVLSSKIYSCLEKMGAPKEWREFFPNDSEEIAKESFLEKIGRIKKNIQIKHIVEEELENGKMIAEKESSHKISILISRLAFTTLFPDLIADNTSEDTSQEELENLRELFFELAMKSQSVVFARALPSMKKQVIIEIKKRYPKLITLAVGDGANDADMIKTAHVGVGISGIEGTAAVNAADYALPQFSMLHTLLFVHGFWNYRRICYLVNFLCYKAIFYVIPMIWFGTVSRYAPFQRWDLVSQTFYNVMYTALPVMSVALWDQILPRKILQDNTKIYQSHKGKLFNYKVFSMWLLRSFTHGSIIWNITYYSFGSTIVNKDGYTHGTLYFSVTMFLSLVMSVVFVGCLDMSSITWLNILAIFSSIASTMGMTALVSFAVPTIDTYGLVEKLWGDQQFWLVMMLSVTIIFIIEFTIRSYNIIFQSNDINQLRERFICKGDWPVLRILHHVWSDIIHNDDLPDDNSEFARAHLHAQRVSYKDPCTFHKCTQKQDH